MASISSARSPAGRCQETVSPTPEPMRARASGETQLTLPCSASASSSDDGEAAMLAGGVAHLDHGAESDLVGRLLRRVDQDGALDPRFEIADLAVDMGEAELLGRIVGSYDEPAMLLLRRGEALVEEGEPAAGDVIRMLALRQLGQRVGRGVGIGFADKGSTHRHSPARSVAPRPEGRSEVHRIGNVGARRAFP